MFYDEYRSWYESIKNIDPYKGNISYYKDYLIYLKIIKNISENNKKNILRDIINYPFSLNKLKLLLLFFLPKKIISYLNEKYY